MIRLQYDNQRQRADFVRGAGNLELDGGLETAILISLFTDAPARADDDVPAVAERRGYWADVYSDVPGDVTGSRLWLLRRARCSDAEKLARAVEYAREALRWLVDDGIAASVDASATWARSGVLLMSVDIRRPDKVAPRWQATWEVHVNAI